MRSLKRPKAKAADANSFHVQFQAASTRLKNGRRPLDPSDRKPSLRRNAATSKRNEHAGKAGASFSTGRPSLVEVASAGGSNGEPTLCQTPATIPTTRHVDRESVAASRPTPPKNLSQPLVESGVAVLRNAASSSLHGKVSSAGGLGSRSDPLTTANDLNRWDARGNHRSLRDRPARPPAKHRTTPPQE